MISSNCPEVTEGNFSIKIILEITHHDHQGRPIRQKGTQAFLGLAPPTGLAILEGAEDATLAACCRVVETIGVGRQIPSPSFLQMDAIMCRRRRSRGLTMVELLMLIGIAVCICIMVLPAILAARESTRKATCADNLRRFGIAYYGYAVAQKQFVASSGVTRDTDGKIQAVDGWSWLVMVLPYMDDENQRKSGSGAMQKLYDTLDVQHGRPLTEPAGAKGTPHADALATRLPGLLCPSFGGSPYADPRSKKGAIINYKPLGATHIESLSVASPNPLTPKFKPGPWPKLGMSGRTPPHPDGNCFPGTNLTFGDIRNGTANTMSLVESLEPRYARWTVGAEAAVVGFPRCVEFERLSGRGYMPKGYQNAVDKRPEADSTYWTYHTYLDWDYRKNPYDAADGTSGERYGPSSNHPGVVNHLFMDGSARNLSKDIDIALYMNLIRGRWHWAQD